MHISKTLVIITFALPSIAQTLPEEPYRITHPTERVFCFSQGLEVSPITSCAIESDAGVVLIDTGLSPSMGSRTRSRIAAEQHARVLWGMWDSGEESVVGD